MTADKNLGSNAEKAIFVGRERELGALREALSDALSGRGRLFLITGDPGIGKSWLINQLADSAEAEGARVLRVHCWEEGGAPGFWPWIQLVRSCIRGSDAAALSADLGSGGSVMAEFLPELRMHLPQIDESPRPVPSDPEQARFVLFDAITEFFKNVARRTPLFLVLEALHAADPPSLLLFRYLAREIAGSRILAVGAYRDEAVRRVPAVARLLATLGSEGKSLSLRGFTEADVSSFLEQLAGVKPAQNVVAAVHLATDGNPFFVDEISRRLIAEGKLDAPVSPGSEITLEIPEGVRGAIRRRLEPLSEAVCGVLGIASVIGREFDVATLRPLTGLAAEDLLERLHEAQSVGLLTATANRSGGFAFSHALVRETLYDDLPAAHRLALHRQIGEVFEGAFTLDPDSRLPVLAHHFFRHATLGGDPDKAIVYLRRAARRAASLLAFEETAAHYERALQAADLKEHFDDRERCELLLALGEARSSAVDPTKSKAAFLQAAGLARKMGAAEELARAALGFAGPFTFVPGMVDAQAVSLLEEALQVLGPADRLLRAHLLARLALGLYFADDAERRGSISREALDLARRLHDSGTLATALIARHVAVWRPENLEERLVSAIEAVRLAEEIGDPELLVRSYSLKIIDLLEAGDLGALDRAIESHARLAEQLRQPLHIWQSNWFRATRAFFEGHFEDAERLARRALSFAESAQGRVGAGTVRLQILTLRWHQGRLAVDELEDTVDRLAEQHLKVPAWRCAMIHMYRDVGRNADAHREFESLANNGFADLPRDSTWLSSLALLAEYCAWVGDAPRAAVLYDLLLPYADRNIVTAYAIVCYGSAARHLGLLAATTSRWEEAERHFENAIAMNSRMKAHPLLATTQCSYAEMLLARGGRGDRSRAARFLDQALGTARELGMVKLVERVLALRGETTHRTRGHASVSERKPQAVDAKGASSERIFRKEGRFWTIVYRDRDLRIRDTKGMRYLAHLLRFPGQEFHVSDLAARVGVSSRMTSGPAALAERGEGATVVAGERGSRQRKGAQSAERIRKAVTNRIRDSIARIQDQHPALGSHLLTAVRTGKFCSYAPAKEAPWQF